VGSDERTFKKYGKYHCFKCGKIWGSGDDIDSYGVCLECLGEYINNKRIKNGQYPCFGKFNQDSKICDSCKWKKVCKELYEERNGIK